MNTVKINLVKKILFAAVAMMAVSCGPVLAKAATTAAAPSCCASGSCCATGNCCASGNCCKMEGCCKADRSCCDAKTGTCTSECGCKTMNCCAGGSCCSGAAKKTAAQTGAQAAAQTAAQGAPNSKCAAIKRYNLKGAQGTALPGQTIIRCGDKPNCGAPLCSARMTCAGALA